MLKRTVVTIILALGISLAASAPGFGQSGNAAAGTTAVPVKTGYAPVNGLHLYYEIYGAGKPLVLLHGGLGSIEMFGPVLTMLAASRQVIAVDLQDHGRTADINRPLRYELMADDIAALITFLGFGKADVMGYSLGGGVALQTAIRHPDVVGKLVVVSAAVKRDGWYPEILAGEQRMGAASAEQMKQSPMYQLYASLAPRPQDWPILLEKVSDLLTRDYDWSRDVKAMKVPTLLVFADQDAVQIGDTVELFRLQGGAQHAPTFDGSGRPNAELAILPGVTHYNIFMSPALAAVVAPFLGSAP